jgi:hypothetical protein
MGSVADVSDVDAASIFRKEVIRICECSCLFQKRSNKTAVSPSPTVVLLDHEHIYSQGFTQFTYFDPEDGDIIFIRNIGNAAQTKSMQRPKKNKRNVHSYKEIQSS